MVSTYASVCLVKQRRRDSANERHDQQHTRNASALRIELHLLLPQSTATHTHTGHEEHAGEQTAYDRALYEVSFPLCESDTIQNNFYD